MRIPVISDQGDMKSRHSSFKKTTQYAGNFSPQLLLEISDQKGN